MTQIICLHLGGAGTKIGMEFWEKLREEHQIDTPDPICSQKFFEERINGRTSNRAIFIDTDARLRQLIRPQMHWNRQTSIITQNQSCKNLFAEGMYIQGGEINEQILNTISVQAERCDRLSGFIMTNSICGGVGSGVGALVLRIMRENYPGNMLQNFQVLPETNGNVNPLQIYNSVLQNHSAIEQTDICLPIENKIIHSRLFRYGHMHSTFKDINSEIGKCMVQYTAPYRFGGQLNTNQRKMATNMILFPRIKFLVSATSFQNEPDYLSSALEAKNAFIQRSQRNQSRLFTMGYTSRGDPFSYESQINNKIKQRLKSNNNSFVDWIPSSVHVSIVDKANKRGKPSSISVTNSPQGIEWLKRVGTLFASQFRRKGFLHHYTSLGMDEMQFTEAESNCNDLQSEYIPWGADVDDEYQQFFGIQE